MFDSLYHRDKDMKVIPWLATSYENPDERTWRFHLRKGVKFHNGNDFKANDVRFTLGRLLEADATLDARMFVEKVQVVDDYTVDIVTKEPYAALMTRVVLWHMTDEEYFKEVGPQGFGRKPIGTGPFSFVEWAKDERIVMQANSNYWGGSPKIKTVIFKPIPETATRIGALEAGGVDLISDVPPAYVQRTFLGIKAVTVPGTRAFFVAMNVNRKPFNDVRVRQAMNYAVDVDSIIKNVLKGRARRIDNPLLPEAFGYTPTPLYRHDAAKSKRLLAEAGYPNGFEMEIDVEPALKEMAEAVAGQLREVGVKAKINVMERAALNSKYEPGGSQAALTSWGNSEADADGMLSKQFWSKRYGCDLLGPKGSEGCADVYSGYANARVDALIEAGARTVDPKKRKETYAKALRAIVWEAPWIFLYTPTEIYAVRNRVQDWVPRPDALIILDKTSVRN
jgi:peptide/nickel transport system substrate-binding protein